MTWGCRGPRSRSFASACFASHIGCERGVVGTRFLGIAQVSRAARHICDRARLSAVAARFFLLFEILDATRARRAARSLNSASRDCRLPLVRLLASCLRFEFPLEVDGRDSIGETGGLCWVLRRHRNVNHEGFVRPPRARPGLQNTRRFEDAVFLPGAAEDVTTTSRPAPHRIPDRSCSVSRLDNRHQHAAGRDRLQLQLSASARSASLARSTRGVRSPCITCKPWTSSKICAVAV